MFSLMSRIQMVRDSAYHRTELWCWNTVHIHHFRPVHACYPLHNPSLTGRQSGYCSNIILHRHEFARPFYNTRICTDSRTNANYSTQTSPPEPSQDDDSQLSVFQRFKKVYKEYGKTLIVVHILTSIGWYGCFYVIARSGIDLVPLLAKLGAGESLLTKFSKAGDFLVAYLLYEIAKPVRYIATLAGTRVAVQYLRKYGYIEELNEEDKLRNLAKEGREDMKEIYHERKDELKEKYQERKEEMKEKYQDKKDEMKEKYTDRKDDIKEYIDKRRTEFKDRRSNSKERSKRK